MIIQITHPEQLKGPILQDLNRCFKRYSEKAQDGVTIEDLAEILKERVFPQQNAWLFLALDDKVRVQGFAIVRLVHDVGLGWAVDLWHVYVDPKAPPGLFKEGLDTIKELFASRGITRLQFCTARNSEAWNRLLKDYGFKEKAVIFEMEVPENGQPENRSGIERHGPSLGEGITPPDPAGNRADESRGNV